MIVSFVAESHIDDTSFVRQNVLFTTPKYIAFSNRYRFDLQETVRLLSLKENLSGIVVPLNKSLLTLPLLNYSPLHLCLALRNIEPTRYVPIFLIGDVNEPLSKITNKNFGIFHGLANNLLPISVEDIDIIKLFEMGKQLIAPKDGRHSIANRWGAYQLQNTLSSLRSVAPAIHLRTQLCCLDVHLGCELTLRELTSHPQATSLDHCRTLLQDIEDLLAKDNESPHRILVIEDELELGWRLAYEILFQMQNVHIDFCESKAAFDETYASKVSNGEYSLILLDMRLDQEADPPDVHRYNIEKVSGIQVLRDIKERNFNTPVIMTTASNKAWTLESASEYGANGFWSKESPMTYTSQEETVRSCQSLLETIKETLSWSLTVRPIIQKFTECTDIIMCIHDHLQPQFVKSQKDKCKGLKDGLVKKKKYLHSLLHKPESEFIQQYTGNRQWEYPYLIIWSLQNDFLPIVSWSKGSSPKCLFSLDRQIGLGHTKTEKKANEQLQYYIKCLNHFDEDEAQNKYISPMALKHVSLLEVHQMCSLIDILLPAPEGTSRAAFVFNSERKWKQLRNKIDIIHGRPANSSAIDQSVTHNLLSFYQDLLEKAYQYVQVRDIYAVFDT